jgi:hypothetical protein
MSMHGRRPLSLGIVTDPDWTYRCDAWRVPLESEVAA